MDGNVVGQCGRCGKPVPPPRRLFCSYHCKVREMNARAYARRKAARKPKECEMCGKPFIRSARARFCSKTCGNRTKQMLRRYGVTPQEYGRLVLEQHGKCAICGMRPIPNNGRLSFLAVDHRHSDGKVRGLLCVRCNAGLGSFIENTHIMMRAIKYLTKDEPMKPTVDIFACADYEVLNMFAGDAK